jgi:DNA-binding transcriptional LysR family regulator
METISFADIRCFLTIARSGSLTRAGELLGLQRAAVSKSLARLEQALGVELFARSTRRLAITRAGSVLQGRAESLVSDIEALRHELQREEKEVGGALTVAAPPELGVGLTSQVFAPFVEAHPRVRLRLKLDYGYEDLFDPDIDLAFRVGDVQDESLVARPLWAFRRVIVASPSLARRLALKTAADLSRAPCLGFDDHTFRSSWSLTDGDVSRTVDVEGRFAARSYPAILAAACAGLGAAYLPEFVVAPFLKSGGLARVLSRWSSEPKTISLLYRPGHSRVRRVSAFAEHLAAFRDLPRGLRAIR